MRKLLQDPAPRYQIVPGQCRIAPGQIQAVPGQVCKTGQYCRQYQAISDDIGQY